MATACLTGLPAFTSALMFFSKAFLLVDLTSGIFNSGYVGLLYDKMLAAV